MDLTDETGYQFAIETDPLTDIVTITIKNKTGTTILGDFQIEYYKVRPFFDSLAELGKTFYPDLTISSYFISATNTVTFTASSKTIALSSGSFPSWFGIGNKIRIKSVINSGIYTVTAVNGSSINVLEPISDEMLVTATFWGYNEGNNWSRRTNTSLIDKTAVTEFSV